MYYTGATRGAVGGELRGLKEVNDRCRDVTSLALQLSMTSSYRPQETKTNSQNIRFNLNTRIWSPHVLNVDIILDSIAIWRQVNTCADENLINEENYPWLETIIRFTQKPIDW